MMALDKKRKKMDHCQSYYLFSRSLIFSFLKKMRVTGYEFQNPKV